MEFIKELILGAGSIILALGVLLAIAGLIYLGVRTLAPIFFIFVEVITQIR